MLKIRYPNLDKEHIFYPGDLIRQRYQKDAQDRLVLSGTESNCTVLVNCPDKGIIKVLAWGHDLVFDGLNNPEQAKDNLRKFRGNQCR